MGIVFPPDFQKKKQRKQRRHQATLLVD
jgi:hypothetical protein